MKNFKELNKKQLALLFFESAMALFYPVFGVLLLTMNVPQFSFGFRIVFGAIFVLYGIYRIYRAYKKLFTPSF